jgi:hypothetical protein
MCGVFLLSRLGCIAFMMTNCTIVPTSENEEIEGGAPSGERGQKWITRCVVMLPTSKGRVSTGEQTVNKRRTLKAKQAAKRRRTRTAKQAAKRNARPEANKKRAATVKQTATKKRVRTAKQAPPKEAR